MKKERIRDAWLPLLIAALVIVGDLAEDYLSGNARGGFFWHSALAVFMIAASFALIRWHTKRQQEAEAILRKARDEMEARVAERTMELTRATEALQEEVAGHKKAEGALRISEEKYRLLFQNMAEGVALYELIYDDQNQPVDWRVLEVNDAYTRHTGIARDKIIGLPLSALFLGVVPEYLPRFSRVVSTQSPVEFETYAKSIGRCVHVVAFPIEGPRFAAVIEDITDRKIAEAAIQRQATILSQLNDAVIGLDQDGRITFWNTGAEKMYGHRAEDVLGLAHEDFPRPAFIGMTRDELSQRLYQGEEVDVESIRLAKDGREVWVESRVMMIYDSLNAPNGFIWVDRDITSRKRSDAVLRDAESELAIAAQERAALAERQRLARELHDSVSQALYGISLGAHTALTMLGTDQDKTREALNFTLSLANAGLTEMRALIFELRPEMLVTEGLVIALEKKAAEMRARRGIEVVTDLCDEPSLPFEAKEALYRIAQEAMLNAVKHAHSSRLDIRLECQADGYRLEVCDNGAGFDPMAAYPGHLGLRSMRERAVAFGGDLIITSASQCGTQIQAYFPVMVGFDSKC